MPAPLVAPPDTGTSGDHAVGRDRVIPLLIILAVLAVAFAAVLYVVSDDESRKG